MEKIFPIRYMLALPLKTGSEFASLGCPQRQLWVFKKTPLKKNDHNHHDIME